jgi:hypothetical protein
LDIDSCREHSAGQCVVNKSFSLSGEISCCNPFAALARCIHQLRETVMFNQSEIHPGARLLWSSGSDAGKAWVLYVGPSSTDGEALVDFENGHLPRSVPDVSLDTQAAVLARYES